ncbi:MAG: HD domain-containing protein [Gemmatimonadales bacterium]
MSGAMHGYSDRINHAFAFTAKYHAPRAPLEGAMSFLAHPANVAVVLARHGADELTIVAGIVHHVIEATPGTERPDIVLKISEKFGSVVLAIATDAADHHVDDRGDLIPWTHRKRVLLNHLLIMEPRALDVCCADEIHDCGTAIALVERLGGEYLATHGLPPAPQALGWYGDLLDALDRRTDWPARAMRHELATLRARLMAALRDDS